MNKFVRSLGVALGIALMGQSVASADPVAFLDGGNNAVTPAGDDISYKLSGISVNFDGTMYTDVYFSTNNVLSFGVGAADFADFPASNIPSVSFNARDWTVDWAGNGGEQADEYMTAELSGNILTLTTAATPFASGNPNSVTPTTTVITVSGVGGQATFSYTVNGAAGSDYSLTAPRTAVRLLNGNLVALSAYNASKVRANSLKMVTTPTLSQSGNTMSCSPGTYKFLNGGSTEEAQNLGALVYTLVVDGKAVSRLGAGSYTSLPAHFFPAITQSVSGSADMKGASWDVSALKNFDARCEVYGWQSGGNIQSSSAQISDAVKTAEIAAMAKAREEERAAANAANFTKEAREMRKRIAARSGK